MVEKHKVADVGELSTDGSRAIVDVGGVEIAVFRVDGEYHAVGNYCVHQGGPLCEGGLSGRITVDDDEGMEWGYDPEERYIHCPWHGWMFDVTTGESVDTEQYRVPTYEVEVEGGEVFVLR